MNDDRGERLAKPPRRAELRKLRERGMTLRKFAGSFWTADFMDGTDEDWYPCHPVNPWFIGLMIRIGVLNFPTAPRPGSMKHPRQGLRRAPARMADNPVRDRLQDHPDDRAVIEAELRRLPTSPALPRRDHRRARARRRAT